MNRTCSDAFQCAARGAGLAAMIRTHDRILGQTDQALQVTARERTKERAAYSLLLGRRCWLLQSASTSCSRARWSSLRQLASLRSSASAIAV